MLKTILAAGSLACTSAMMAETGEHRALQGSGNANSGGLDVSICRWQIQNPDARNFIARSEGTLHDDETDEQVDCSTGACGGAQAHGNGYGDNIDCHATLSAPPTSTITLDFAQMNLENGQGCGTSHDGHGCDILTIYDGSDLTAPVIGVYSGSTLPPPITSTGNSLVVRFETDAGNAALTNTMEDPGFYIDWHFDNHLIANGDGICPAPAVFTDSHGTIHDDVGDVDCTTGQCNGADNGGNGYGDETNCYTTIHAPSDTQIRYTFTQLNLEEFGCSAATTDLPNNGCPAGGCDYVKLFDGQHSTDPLLGTYTGFKQGSDLPEVVTTGEWLRVEFHTDTGNCGISATEDPGFQADWDFVENGQDICQPDSTVLRTEHGVLHDDDTTEGGAYDTLFGSGYGDNLDCGVRIRAPPGGTVNLHIVQMNLEGDGNGICDPNSPQYIGHSCDDNGGDFLKIYDGRNADAPLLASLNGQPTDQIYAQDSFTSTGRDMYVHFETDTGNAGLSGTSSQPGFYAEWELLDDGAACESWNDTPGKGLIGHNNEYFPCSSGTSRTCVQQCEQACCSRSWCESFDYIAIAESGAGGCNLADVSASTHAAAITFNQYDTYYERPIGSLPTSNAPLGAFGCQSRLNSIANVVTDECCPPEGCSSQIPPVCTEQCAANWMPFSRQCSVWISQQEDQLDPVSANCEREQYGRYREGSNHGRCSDGDVDNYEQQFFAACCDSGNGDGTNYCPGAQTSQEQNGEIVYVSSWSDVPPVDAQGNLVCTAACRTFFEEVYSECHPRFENVDFDGTQTTAQALLGFLGVCQGMTGGGNRRNLAVEVEKTTVNPGFLKAMLTKDTVDTVISAAKAVRTAVAESEAVPYTWEATQA